MANKFSPTTDEWIVVDKSGEAWRRITMLSAAVAVSAVLWIFLGSLLLAVGTRDASAGREIPGDRQPRAYTAGMADKKLAPDRHAARPARPHGFVFMRAGADS